MTCHRPSQGGPGQAESDPVAPSRTSLGTRQRRYLGGAAATARPVGDGVCSRGSTGGECLTGLVRHCLLGDGGSKPVKVSQANLTIWFQIDARLAGTLAPPGSPDAKSQVSSLKSRVQNPAPGSPVPVAVRPTQSHPAAPSRTSLGTRQRRYLGGAAATARPVWDDGYSRSSDFDCIRDRPWSLVIGASLERGGWCLMLPPFGGQSDSVKASQTNVGPGVSLAREGRFLE